MILNLAQSLENCSSFEVGSVGTRSCRGSDKDDCRLDEVCNELETESEVQKAGLTSSSGSTCVSGLSSREIFEAEGVGCREEYPEMLSGVFCRYAEILCTHPCSFGFNSRDAHVCIFKRIARRDATPQVNWTDVVHTQTILFQLSAVN